MQPEIRIIVRDMVCKIEAPHHIVQMLDEELMVEHPGAKYMRMRNPSSDGFWHPVSVARKTFPTGLLAMVKKELPMHQIVDERVRPATAPFNENMLTGITLAQHQKEAVQAALDKGRGILAMSVNAGKTHVAMAIALHVAGRAVWMVHRKDLLYQVQEMIEQCCHTRAALFGDSCWDDVTENTKFVVAMPQTIGDRLDLFRELVTGTNVLFIDEAHRGAAGKEYYKVCQSIPAYYRLGLSGTIDTEDPVRDLRIRAATGEPIYTIKSPDLQAIGWSAPCEVVYHRTHNAPMLPGHNWDEAKKQLIVENPERNAEIVWLAMEASREGKPCLVICDSLKHVRIITELLRGEGIRVRQLTGKHAAATRIQARKDLACGALEVLVASIILDEGVNLPELQVLVLGAGGKSSVRFTQRIGRLLRVHKSKQVAIIHDFIDTGSRYVLNHSIRRIITCQKEGFTIRNQKEVEPYLKYARMAVKPKPEDEYGDDY